MRYYVQFVKGKRYESINMALLRIMYYGVSIWIRGNPMQLGNLFRNNFYKWCSVRVSG